MDFIFSSIKILIGAYVLFTVSKVTFESWGERHGRAWVALVGVLAISNMIIHRQLGSSINSPFFTAILFGIVLAGLSPKDSPTVGPWYKRAIYAVVVGTVIGWISYVEKGAI